MTNCDCYCIKWNTKNIIEKDLYSNEGTDPLAPSYP